MVNRALTLEILLVIPVDLECPHFWYDTPSVQELT